MHALKQNVPPWFSYQALIGITITVQSSLFLFPHSSLHSRIQSLVLTVAASFSSTTTTISSIAHGCGLPLQSSSTATRAATISFFFHYQHLTASSSSTATGDIGPLHRQPFSLHHQQLFIVS
jgi:hypothetical protein